MGRRWDIIKEEFKDGREFTTADAIHAVYPDTQYLGHDDMKWAGYYTRVHLTLSNACMYGLVAKRVEKVKFDGKKVYWRLMECTE